MIPFVRKDNDRYETRQKHDMGMVVTFCPFCGGRARPELPVEAPKAADGGDVPPVLKRLSGQEDA